MKVSILIPFLNGNEQLSAAFDAFDRLEIPADVSLEVVIADDGSSDSPDSSLWSGLNIPVKVIRQDHGGQSAATNLAARHAQGDLIWLSAQDVKPLPNSLVELLNCAADYPGSLVQGIILHDPELLQDRFTRYIAAESPFQFTFDSIADETDLPPTFHFAPNALMERHKFLVLGGYDEALPYGFQDTDFAIRWRLNGDRIVLARNSIVHHNHLFQPDAYSERQYRIGHEAVNLFVKWGQERELAHFGNLVRLFVIDGERDAEIANEAIRRWQETGEEPPASLVPDAPQSAFNACFSLILRREFYSGVQNRMRELGIEKYLDVPAGKTSEQDQENPFNWIGRLIAEKVRS